MHGVYDFASLMHYDQIGFLSGQFVRRITVLPPYSRTWQYGLDSTSLADATPSIGDIWALQHLYGGTPPPRAFALAEPVSGAAVGDAWMPSFAWDASQAATLYRLQVSLSPVFDAPEIDIQTSQASYTHTAPLQPRRLYWWRVIASNAQGAAESYPFRSLTFFTAPAYPATLHVDDSAPAAGDGYSWSSPLNDLAAALEAAAASGGATPAVRVAQGIYRPDSGSGDRSRTFWLPDNCMVLGGYAGYGAPDPNARDIDRFETTLSGDLNGDDQPNFVNTGDNSRKVVFSLFNPAATLLEGFTIRGANGDEHGGVPGFGGVIVDSGSPTIRRCRFVGNHATHGGGGLYVTLGAAPAIDRCTFAGNRVINAQPSYFPSFGGGALLGVSTGPFPVTNCIFEHNADAGIGGGAISMNFAFPRFTNCLFDGNTAGTNGGAVLGQAGSQAVLINCTVVHNSASAGGGVSGQGGGAAIIANSILWGNTPDSYTGSATLSYSAVQGGAPGAGNIAQNPAFEPGAFLLSSASPCIDAANSTVVPAGIINDLCGNPRFYDDPATPNTGIGSPPIDMGACEFQGSTCYANCDRSTVAPVLNVNDFTCFLNRYAAADPYANCDGSVVAPVLNVNDFICFQQQFAAGCP